MSSSYYFNLNPTFGVSESHFFTRWVVSAEPCRWWVSGNAEFTKSGTAVIDDFGNLVEVPQ